MNSSQQTLNSITGCTCRSVAQLLGIKRFLHTELVGGDCSRSWRTLVEGVSQWVFGTNVNAAGFSLVRWTFVEYVIQRDIAQ